MNTRRTAYYYMTEEERRAYHKLKRQEYLERVHATYGRTIQRHDPNSHPSQMSHEELLAYKRESRKRCKARKLKTMQYDNNRQPPKTIDEVRQQMTAMGKLIDNMNLTIEPT